MLRPGRGGSGLPPAGGYAGGAGAAGPQSPYPQSPYGRAAGGGPATAQSPYGAARPGVGGLPGGPPLYQSPVASATGTGYSAGGSAGAGGTYGGYSAGGGGGGNYNGGSTGGSYGGYTGGGGNSSNTGSAYGGYSASSGGTLNRDNSFKKKRRNQGTHWTTHLTNPLVWSTVLAAIFFVLTIRYQFAQSGFLKKAKARNLAHALDLLRRTGSEQDALRNELSKLKETHKQSIHSATQREIEVKKLQTQLRELSETTNPHHHKIVKQQEEQLQANASEKAHMSIREQALKTQVLKLQQATSRESRRAVTDKFGPGPHYCEFTVDLPNVPEASSIRTFVVEMAPLMAMPHSVHLFMEQVAHGLWNSGWFYINGPHVLQAGPQADEYELEHGFPEGEDERSSALRPFRAVQLESLAFPEYSNDFPHMPWTLGFTGRPGGPDFYINKVDNSVAHGPGGQEHHDLSETADACFAKVVSGFETLNLMTENPTVGDDNDFQHFYEDPIRIVSITMVADPFTNTTTSSTVEAHTASANQVHVDEGGVAAAAAAVAASDTSAEKLLEKIEAMRAEKAKEHILNAKHRHLPKRMIHRPEQDHMVEP